jgi:hypothetical protein
VSDDTPVIVTPGDGPIDLPPTPRASVEVLACGDCAAVGDRVGPLTLLASQSATVPCSCGCGWDEFVCQLCGKPVGIHAARGMIDLPEAIAPGAGDLFREDI